MKEDLKAKEELWKLKNYFTMKKFIFKKSSKRNQNPHIKIDLIFLPSRGPKSLNLLLYSIMNLNTIISPLQETLNLKHVMPSETARDLLVHTSLCTLIDTFLSLF
jgi:hypothetical protein